jgi:YidC/Oxa1 family membrane protein insertase
MFTTLIVQPITNLLILIYALLPGHNFGLALIIFTIVVRLLMWPLVKRQLHQARAMRKLQPELKRIKKDAKGDRQKESQMMMELYKERGINPFATFPTLILQFVVLIGLYSGLRKIISDPHMLYTFAYPFIQNLSWMQHLSDNIHNFDNTLFGFIDLGRAAVGKEGFYLPAFILVVGSAIATYFQSTQLMPKDKDQRKLRDILKSAGEGKQADQSEVNAAVGQSTKYLLPGMIFIFTINLPAALSLYWLTGGIMAYIQQSIILNRDEEEMEGLAGKSKTKDVSSIPEAEVVSQPTLKTSPKAKKKPRSKRKKK